MNLNPPPHQSPLNQPRNFAFPISLIVFIVVWSLGMIAFDSLVGVTGAALAASGITFAVVWLLTKSSSSSQLGQGQDIAHEVFVTPEEEQKFEAALKTIGYAIGQFVLFTLVIGIVCRLSGNSFFDALWISIPAWLLCLPLADKYYRDHCRLPEESKLDKETKS